jgi:hypothetical protein
MESFIRLMASCKKIPATGERRCMRRLYGNLWDWLFLNALARTESGGRNGSEAGSLFCGDAKRKVQKRPTRG